MRIWWVTQKAAASIHTEFSVLFCSVGLCTLACPWWRIHHVLCGNALALFTLWPKQMWLSLSVLGHYQSLLLCFQGTDNTKQKKLWQLSMTKLFFIFLSVIVDQIKGFSLMCNYNLWTNDLCLTTEIGEYECITACVYLCSYLSSGSRYLLAPLVPSLGACPVMTD